MKTVLTGQPERIYVEFRDADGTLVDPARPKVVIFDPSGDPSISSSNAIQEATGVYYYTFTAATAYGTERGEYQAWFEGYINGALITMDTPIRFEVIDTPVVPSEEDPGIQFVKGLRVSIGDNFQDEYVIPPTDMNYFVIDGFKNANSVYDFGFRALLSTAGNDKSGKVNFYFWDDLDTTTSLPYRQKQWYNLHVVKDIMESQVRQSMFGPGNINAGDIKINVAGAMKSQLEYLEMLKKQINDWAYDLKLNGTDSGYLVNTYEIRDLDVAEY